jgi:hypothetical protein
MSEPIGVEMMQNSSEPVSAKRTWETPSIQELAMKQTAAANTAGVDGNNANST